MWWTRRCRRSPPRPARCRAPPRSPCFPNTSNRRASDRSPALGRDRIGPLRTRPSVFRAARNVPPPACALRSIPDRVPAASSAPRPPRSRPPGRRFLRSASIAARSTPAGSGLDPHAARARNRTPAAPPRHEIPGRFPRKLRDAGFFQTPRRRCARRSAAPVNNSPIRQGGLRAPSRPRNLRPPAAWSRATSGGASHRAIRARCGQATDSERNSTLVPEISNGSPLTLRSATEACSVIVFAKERHSRMGPRKDQKTQAH